MDTELKLRMRKQIGSRIRTAIGDRELTPVAAHIGVSVSTLRRFRDGTHDISYRELVLLAEALDKPVEWFKGEEVAA